MNITSKLVTIESPGKIPTLGDIVGPIRTPSRLSIDTIIELINAGKVVYEVNPKNINEKVRLSRLNVYKTNFNSTIKSAVEMQKKVVKEIVVKTNTKPVITPTSKPSDTVIPETGEGMISSEDLFQSNSHSDNNKKKRH